MYDTLTCLCSSVCGARLAVAALSLLGHAFTVSSTIFRRGCRTSSVPLSDSSTTQSVTFWPLCPLWPITMNCKNVWEHNVDQLSCNSCTRSVWKVHAGRVMKRSLNTDLGMLEKNRLDYQTELLCRILQAEHAVIYPSAETWSQDRMSCCKHSRLSTRTICSPLNGTTQV